MKFSAQTKKISLPIIVALALLVVGCNSARVKELAALTSSPIGAVESGKYPNLFGMIGVSDEELKERLEADYQQFFYGDDEKERVFYPDGENENGAKGYILDVNSKDVRSEGMSYGMMIAVQMDKKEDFDAIWNWSLSHMYHWDKKHPAHGYFIWSINPDGKPNDEMPAPDGEEYYATALYFAAARWGNGEGIYDYSQWADKILTDILHREKITGPSNGKTMSAGNMFNLEHAMVRFTPDLVHSEHTDASYHLPAFYEIWAKLGPKEDRAFWKRAAQVSRDYFVKTAHPETALTPDYGNFDGTPWAAPWRKESVDFRYDAWRTAMNWSMDWNWWRADPRQQELSNKIQAFFESQGMDDYVSLYSLAGEPLGGGHTSALIATNATASLAATDPRRKKFVKALWKHKMPTGQYRYYDGMLYMFGLLHTGGQFKDWTSETAQSN